MPLFFASLRLRVRFSLDGRTIHSRTFGKCDGFYGRTFVRQSRRIYQTLSRPGNEGLGLRVWSGRDFGRARYRMLQEKNGGQTCAGRQLGSWLTAGGLAPQKIHGRYECYPDSRLIAEYLALQLERAGDIESGRVLRNWANLACTMFAQAWVSAIAVKA
jgi:hypothetical protein